VGGAAVEPAGEGEAGAVHGQDFVFDDVTVFEERKEKGEGGEDRRDECMIEGEKEGG